MDACPGHILESTKEIEMKLGLQIDDSERNGSAHEPELSPVNHLFFHNGCLSGHIVENTKGILIKVGLQIDSSEGTGSTPKR